MASRSPDGFEDLVAPWFLAGSLVDRTPGGGGRGGMGGGPLRKQYEAKIFELLFLLHQEYL